MTARAARWRALPVVALALLALAAYGNVIRGEFVFDDEFFVQRNAFIRDLSRIGEMLTSTATRGSGVSDSFYRPLQTLAWAVVYRFSGLAPAGYHLLNIILHAANGMLAYLLLAWIVRRARPPGPRGPKPGRGEAERPSDATVRLAAFAGAAFFLLHPVQTEAVSYVSGLSDPLSFLFLLLALLSYARLAEAGSRRAVLAVLVVAAAAAAMLAKERAVLAVVLLLLFDISFVSSRSPAGGEGRYRLGVYAALAAVTAAWFVVHSRLVHVGRYYLLDEEYVSRLSVRLATMFPILVEYLRLVVLPHPLYYQRNAEVFRTFLRPEVLGSLLVLAAAAVYAVRSFRRRPHVFFAFFWFFAALAPTSGVIPVNGYLMEHWLYFSMFGAAVLVAVLAARHRAVLVVALAAAAVMGAATASHNRVWRTARGFYEYNLRYTPGSVPILNNLGVIHLLENDDERSMEYFRRAVAGGDVFASTHHNMAQIFIRRNDMAGALREYGEALRLNPDYLFTHQDLAVLYRRWGDAGRAAYHERRVREILGR